MSKRIKFPLVMKNGSEARDLDSLIENFDLESVAEHFISGKLEKWLENNYYDDILDEIRDLDLESDDFGRRLTEIFGVEWDQESGEDLKKLMKSMALKEQIKPFISDKKLSDIRFIADSQEELENLVKEGSSPVYLWGEKFVIREWMSGVECIGINGPTVELEIADAEEYKKRQIILKDVQYADEKMRKIARGISQEGPYYLLLELLGTYLDKVQERS